MKSAAFFSILIPVVFSFPVLGDEPTPDYDRRWVWVMTNLLVEKEADRVVSLIERAGRDGYNGVVISDYKLNFLERMPKSYFAHVERVKQAAEKAKVEIIPAVLPIGYSNGLLSNDTNLVEGMPVENVPYVVKGREALLVSDPAARIINGDLEQTRGDIFTGFGYQDEPGKATVADREVVHQGKVSCRMQNLDATPVCRLIQKVKVRPPCLLPAVVLDEDPRSCTHRRVPTHGDGCSDWATAQLPRGWARTDPRLDPDRGRLQLPGPDRSEPLRRALGRQGGHALAR